jgi:5-methylcytosine-specific restriction endonuclease McrA
MAEPLNVINFPTQTRRARRVNSWRWNEVEDELLADLPPEIERLYLRGIRKHMDYATGITGQKRRVSMDMFDELLTYYPPAGSREKPRRFSRQQITRMLDKLEGLGLIERLHRGKGVKAAMEFRLPLACSDVDEQRADSEQRGASQEIPRPRAVRETNSEQGPSKEERSTSGSPVTPSSPYGEDVAASAPEKTKAKSRKKWGEDIDHELVNEMHAVISRDLTNPKKPNANAWANDFRLMRTVDGRTVEQIRYLIIWTAEHHFWSTVILCPAKMRAKWDQLEKQVKQLKESRHENRNSSHDRRAEQDRVAASLANPHDTSWADGLFDEGGAEVADRDAGEPSVYPHGGDFSEDVADVVHHGRDADAGETGACVIDGELVIAADAGAFGHGY